MSVRFEDTKEFFDAVLEWMVSDDDSVHYAAARFTQTAEFDKALQLHLLNRGDTPRKKTEEGTPS